MEKRENPLHDKAEALDAGDFCALRGNCPGRFCKTGKGLCGNPHMEEK